MPGWCVCKDVQGCCRLQLDVCSCVFAIRKGPRRVQHTTGSECERDCFLTDVFDLLLFRKVGIHGVPAGECRSKACQDQKRKHLLLLKRDQVSRAAVMQSDAACSDQDWGKFGFSMTPRLLQLFEQISQCPAASEVGPARYQQLQMSRLSALHVLQAMHHWRRPANLASVLCCRSSNALAMLSSPNLKPVFLGSWFIRHPRVCSK